MLLVGWRRDAPQPTILPSLSTTVFFHSWCITIFQTHLVVTPSASHLTNTKFWGQGKKKKKTDWENVTFSILPSTTGGFSEPPKAGWVSRRVKRRSTHIQSPCLGLIFGRQNELFQSWSLVGISLILFFKVRETFRTQMPHSFFFKVKTLVLKINEATPMYVLDWTKNNSDATPL